MTRCTVLLKVLIFSLIISSTIFAQSKEIVKINLPVHKFNLKNGLTVLLYQDNSIPMISYHTWYKVGSRDEYKGVTGAAHMLEHMMFKGSKKYSGQDFERILHENGIVNNAFTNYDYTGFYQNLPSAKLELMMQLEVDRMSQLLLREEDLNSEREVVKEERRWRIDNNPLMSLFELTMGTVFRVHNYRNPIIGSMADISNFNIETLKKFYQTFYVPNNAVLVLAGDIKINEAKRLIEKYYGSLEAKPLPEKNNLLEPLQKHQYNAKIKKNVQGASFNVAFQSVAQNHQDMYALDLICQMIGSGTSSRLYKRLINGKEVATSAYCNHFNMKDHGVFNIHVSMKPGIPLEEALNTVYNEIYLFRSFVIKEAELDKAKILSIKSIVDSLKTIDGKARALAASEITTGSHDSIIQDIQKYQLVTVNEIKTIAAKYLNQSQRSVVIMESKK